MSRSTPLPAGGNFWQMPTGNNRKVPVPVLRAGKIILWSISPTRMRRPTRNGQAMLCQQRPSLNLPRKAVCAGTWQALTSPIPGRACSLFSMTPRTVLSAPHRWAAIAPMNSVFMTLSEMSGNGLKRPGFQAMPSSTRKNILKAMIQISPVSR